MKTNETKSFKVKIWGGFDHYKRIKVFTIKFNAKSIANSNNNLLTRPHASSRSTNSFFSWTYCNTSTHACDFEIPLKGFRSPSVVNLCSSNQVLPMLDCRSCFSRRLFGSKVQHLLDLTRSNTQVFQKSSKRSQGFPFICGLVGLKPYMFSRAWTLF